MTTPTYSGFSVEPPYFQDRFLNDLLELELAVPTLAFHPLQPHLLPDNNRIKSEITMRLYSIIGFAVLFTGPLSSLFAQMPLPRSDPRGFVVGSPSGSTSFARLRLAP